MMTDFNMLPIDEVVFSLDNQMLDSVLSEKNNGFQQSTSNLIMDIKISTCVKIMSMCKDTHFTV